MTKKGLSKQITIRSAAAEYLTFIAATGENGVDVIYQNENIWLSQKMIATLYSVDVRTVNEHLLNIFADSEIDKISAIRNFRITATDGKTYDTKHYSLEAIIAVGYRVNSARAVQFRKWATGIIKDYSIQGWAMDVQRLKNGGSILTRDFFERQLEKIREIRLSERLFYQKITDIYATSIDYDKDASTTKEFFAKVQNKMHFAIHGRTAAELIYERANAEKGHMGLTTWEDAPSGKIQKYDVTIAKNYLTEEELSSLGRIVNAYLDLAEDRAKRQIPMTMEDWSKRLDIFLQAADREILQNAGKISDQIAKEFAESEFEKFRIKQDQLYESDFDKELKRLQGIVENVGES
jgi:hypothetical protein